MKMPLTNENIVKSIINETFTYLQDHPRRGEVSSPVVKCFINSKVHYKRQMYTVLLENSMFFP